MSLHDDTFDTHPDLVELKSTGTTLPPPPPDRHPMRLVAALAVIFVLIAGFGAWWLSSSTVSSSDYDEVVADLDAAEEALAASAAALEESSAALAEERSSSAELEALVASMTEEGDRLTEDLADARAEAALLSDGNSELRSVVATAREVAEVLALIDLNLDSSLLDGYVEAGGDTAVIDDLLEQLGRDETAEEWANSWDDFDGAWAQADRAVFATDDDELIDSWRTWNWAEAGSDEEYVAWSDLRARIDELMLESLVVGN